MFHKLNADSYSQLADARFEFFKSRVGRFIQNTLYEINANNFSLEFDMKDAKMTHWTIIIKIIILHLLQWVKYHLDFEAVLCLLSSYLQFRYM